MKLVFVFPGQGAQAVGMGHALFENSAAARAAFEAVDIACGASISTLCFEGPEAALKETKNTQPCLFATSVAALAACREAGLEPVAVAGHSVGEYAALVAAGAFDIATGAKLVQQRALAMAEAATQNPGSMAAVLGLDASVVQEVCDSLKSSPVIGGGGGPIVVPANDNCPGQVVISGEVAALEAVAPLLKERGAKRVLPLEVSGAFHSPLMASAAEALKPIIDSAAIAAPRLPIVANVTADYETTSDEIKANLAAQVAGPVRWTETIQKLAGDGYTHFVECGSGKVLAGLIKRIAPEAIVFSVGDSASLAAAVEGLKT
ncbi:ACP S-malonyltransferase [Armatimonas sp.]|uniref:ACP S-malonyltransferase n=1 Tax=Armatimonas sp. TaxID=1872638 RepID=UPI00286C0170|nr:ACP S-malonyltransferase [Armatimonas sp.]